MLKITAKWQQEYINRLNALSNEALWYEFLEAQYPDESLQAMVYGGQSVLKE